jgi:hypothetical protein
LAEHAHHPVYRHHCDNHPFSIYTSANIEKKDLDDAARTQQGGPYIKLPDGVTRYELTGPADGPVVVLIHGATIPMYLWDEQVAPLSEAGYRVLRYDMFGRGYSDRPEGNYSQAFYRMQLADLLDALKISKPVDLISLHGRRPGNGLHRQLPQPREGPGADCSDDKLHQ